MFTRLLAASLFTLVATAAGASDAPHAGSYDDVDYGGIPHASFGVELVRPDGVTVVGSQYDDVDYGGVPHASFGVELVRPDGVAVVGSQYDDTLYAPPAEEKPAETRSEPRLAERAACTCHA